MDVTSLGLQNLTKQNWRGRTYSPTYKNSSDKQSAKVKLWSYDDILLKLYLEITTSTRFDKLIKSGKATLETCITAWEEIVRKNSEENQSLQYQAYFSLVKAYTVLLSQHTTVKLLLMRSSLSGSKTEGFKETIEELKKRGYKLDLSSTEKYAESIAFCMNRSNAMVTKINMKQSEIKDYLKRAEEKSSKVGDGFTDLLANLEEALGGNRNLPEDITLAKYNSLKKIAQAKVKAAKAAQRNHGSGNR